MGLFSWLLPTNKRSGIIDTSLRAMLGAADSAPSGVVVTEENALRFGAVYRAVTLNATNIASLSKHIYIDGDKGRERIFNNLSYLLNNKPNATLNAFTFWETIAMHRQLWGNAYATITRDQNGNLKSFNLKYPWQSDVFEYEGAKFYKFSGDARTYAAEEVLHFMGVSTDGIKGKSPIRLAAEAIGLGMASRDTASRLYKNGLFTRAYLELPGGLAPGQREEVADDFKESYGSANQWTIPVVHSGAQLKQLNMSLEDAQFISTQELSLEEIARMFGVPLSKMMHKDGAKYNGNVEQQNLEYVTDSLRAECKRYEAELEAKLVPFGSPQIIKFNLEDLLRGDLRTRSQFYRDLFYIGALSPNEIRKMESLNPYDGGEEYFTPVNMVDAEQLDLMKQNLKQTNEA